MMAKRKQPARVFKTDGPKCAVKVEQTGSYMRKRPAWRFEKSDTQGKWAVKACVDIDGRILRKLASYEGMTWAEIMQASGGKSEGNGNNNHFEKICDFTKEAQDRARDIVPDEDELFSLRLTGRERLYGTLHDGVMNVIWYDREHEIYAGNGN